MENKTETNTNEISNTEEDSKPLNKQKANPYNNNPYGNTYGNAVTDMQSKEFRAMAYEMIGYKVDGDLSIPLKDRKYKPAVK